MIKKIYVKGTKYQIKFEKDQNFYLGETDFENKVIKIVKNEDNKELKQTIIHELLHAYFGECGLVEYRRDETLINFLDSIMLELMEKAEKIEKLYKIFNPERKGGK